MPRITVKINFGIEHRLPQLCLAAGRGHRTATLIGAARVEGTVEEPQNVAHRLGLENHRINAGLKPLRLTTSDRLVHRTPRDATDVQLVHVKMIMKPITRTRTIRRPRRD